MRLGFKHVHVPMGHPVGALVEHIQHTQRKGLGGGFKAGKKIPISRKNPRGTTQATSHSMAAASSVDWEVDMDVGWTALDQQVATKVEDSFAKGKKTVGFKVVVVVLLFNPPPPPLRSVADPFAIGLA